MPRIFVSATRQNVGKTTTSLGLMATMADRGLRAHFIKPIGQRYLVRDDVKADEDAILIRDCFGQPGTLSDMSPVTIPRGFTEQYVYKRDRDGIYRAIDAAIARIEQGSDVTVVEGTGHAGVGAVIDASNADVARHLNAGAIIIASGGIGSAIDEIALNHALFRQAGVEVVGAIVNKVTVDKYDKVANAVRQGLANQGIRCLGVVPYSKDMTLPTVRQLHEELGFAVIAGPNHLDNRVDNTIVAAMTPQNTIGHIRNGTFVITPGDRVDNILVSIAAHLVGRLQEGARISGILLTGGLMPDPTIRALLDACHVPVLLAQEDTFSASGQVERLTVKIRPSDGAKVAFAAEMARTHLDVDAILAAIGVQR